jgi:hypothetical protein
MQDLLKFYDNKFLRSLVQLIPGGIGSAIDVFATETINKIRAERLRAFFDELETGTIELNEDLISSEDFLHNYFSTIRIVLNTRRREKIKLFGQLFNTAVSTEIINSPGKYEFYLKILDELTLDEIEILDALAGLEATITIQDSTKNARLNANKQIWDDFKTVLEKRFGINADSLDEVLIRIERTGCIYIPRVTANDLRPYAAMTTRIFSELKSAILR